MKSLIVALIVSSGCVVALAAPSVKPAVRPDGYPADVAKLLLEQAKAEGTALPKLAPAGEQYLINQRRWAPGSRVLVAFNGGTPQMHRDIAAVASKWLRDANLTFDFGYDPTTRRYREWRATDTARMAHIRIGFDQPGYWSAVGIDSMNDKSFGAGKASMNFQGFVQAWPNLKPYMWESVVLHEFGHALGFRHEHQRQSCAKEIRWVDGPNPDLEPSIYRVMNEDQGWPESVVDVNYKPVDMQAVQLKTEIQDKQSNLYYATPARAFMNGADSPCYLEKPNGTLSAGDLLGVAKAYPKAAHGNPAEMEKRPSAGQLIDSARAPLTSAEKEAVIARSKVLEAAARPLLYIHIQRESDRALAKKLQLASTKAGFFAPGIENVSKKGGKSGKVTQVRYFRPNDVDAANDTLKLIKTVIGGDVQLIKVGRYSKSVTRNLVEVWFP